MYRLTGQVPAHEYDPGDPVFSHHESTKPTGKPYTLSRPGRMISVTTENEQHAEYIAHAMRGERDYNKGPVFINVEIEEV